MIHLMDHRTRLLSCCYNCTDHSRSGILMKSSTGCFVCDNCGAGCAAAPQNFCVSHVNILNDEFRVECDTRSPKEYSTKKREVNDGEHFN